MFPMPVLLLAAVHADARLPFPAPAENAVAKKISLSLSREAINYMYPVLTPDSKYLLTADCRSKEKMRYKLLQIDIETGKEKVLFETMFSFYGLNSSPDGKYLALATQSVDEIHLRSSVFVLDAETGKVVLRLTNSGGRAAFNQDASLVAVVGEDKAIHSYSIKENKLITSFDKHPDWGISFRLSKNWKRMASTCKDGIVRIWDVETGKVLHQLKKGWERLHCVEFGPEDKELLLGGDSGDGYKYLLWRIDVEKGEVLQRIRSDDLGNIIRIDSIFVSAVGDLVVLRDRGFTVVNPKGWKCLCYIDERSSLCTFSSDGRHLVIGSSELKFWDVKKLLEGKKEK